MHTCDNLQKEISFARGFRFLQRRISLAVRRSKYIPKKYTRLFSLHYSLGVIPGQLALCCSVLNASKALQRTDMIYFYRVMQIHLRSLQICQTGETRWLHEQGNGRKKKLRRGPGVILSEVWKNVF